MLARLLYNTYRYYAQFARAVGDSVAALREPIAKQLAEHVQLAKWEDHSYFALKVSSERNSKTLRKFATQYAAALCQVRPHTRSRLFTLSIACESKQWKPSQRRCVDAVSVRATSFHFKLRGVGRMHSAGDQRAQGGLGESWVPRHRPICVQPACGYGRFGSRQGQGEGQEQEIRAESARARQGGGGEA